MSKQCLFFKLNPTYRAAVGVWLALTRPLPILKSSIGKCVFNSFWVDATFKQVVLRDLLTIRMGLKGCIRPLAIINLSWPERKEKETSQIQSYPRLQQFIQLYCYLYITDTLYSGEIIGRIIHGTLCDAPQGHKYWCGRPERGEQSSWGEAYGLYTLPLAHHHLPVNSQSACIPTCTYWDSPDSHMRRETEPCCNTEPHSTPLPTSE